MSKTTGQLPITPDTKVGALLDAYPDLEEVLIGIAPVFKKLRNPALRRTVARLTSLRQAAKVGGVSLGEMISTLRTEAGLQEAWKEEGGKESSGDSETRPDWLDACEAIETHDAREEIEGGGHPLPTVLAATEKLEAGQAFAIVTPFLPAPMIDKIAERGFNTWTDQRGPEHFVTYFARR